MASGHVSRIKRPNTWLHRPMLQNVKKAIANTGSSTHGSLAMGLLTKTNGFFDQIGSTNGEGGEWGTERLRL
jgi:hypothetical protein